MSSHHQSNLGSYGDRLPVDLDGYTHTTAEEWRAAPIDMSAEDRADAEYMAEWSEDMARQSREALDEAEAGVAEWRAGH